MKQAQRFRCIHCLEECPSLYRRVGETDIKLAVCSHCNRVVDHYCEREVFLVVLDLVLLRQYAYRHVLYNFSIGGEYSAELWKIVVYGSLLRAHLATVARDDTVEVDETMSAAYTFVQFSIISGFVDCMAIVLMMYGIRRCLGVDIAMKRAARLRLLPMLFNVVTAIVHFWENTASTRALSASMILVYRCVFQLQVIQTPEMQGPLWFLAGGLLVVVIELFVSLTTAFIWGVVSFEPLPCPGIIVSGLQSLPSYHLIEELCLG